MVISGDKLVPLSSDRQGSATSRETVGIDMNQLDNLGGVARELAHLGQATATGLGLTPAPTMIVIGTVALFAIIGLVVGGTGGRPRGAHRA
jgi:hypothetical protein